IILGPQETRFGPVVLSVDGGALRASGAVGETLDVTAEVTDLPLSIADLVQPDLGLRGRVNGSLRATGPVEAPQARFDLAFNEVISALSQSYGLPPVDVSAAGDVANQVLDLTAGLQAGPQARARLSGQVPLDPEAPGLDLDLSLTQTPLALANRLAGDLGLTGTLSGTAQVAGAVAAPTARFDLAVAQASVADLRALGIAPLDASTRGTFAGERLEITAFRLRNEQGLEASASGTVPLSGPGLSVQANGTAPLQLANLALADRATQMSGSARATLSVTGRLSDPQARGEVILSNATIVDPQSNLRLEDVGLQAQLEGDRVVLSAGRARFLDGGRASLSGEIGLDPAQNFPLDLALGLQRARYSDGDTLSTILGGEITVNGAALGDLAIGGAIELEQTEIVVPDGFGLAARDVLSVSHRSAPQDVSLTLDRAGLRDPEPQAGSQRIALDLVITAPNRMFVRGRGLDTELGGTLRLTGTLEDLVPVGGFEMRRGRFNVIGQRIAFSEGAVTLRGTLDPILSFVARTETDDALVTVTVSGTASDPQITFSSAPELPQDEILARLIFNRSVGELSAFQLAQLAGSIATLTGAGGPGLVEALRTNIGLDNLELVSGDDGEVGVRAGKYIARNVYVDVESESDGDTRTSINLDLTDALTARGTVGTDGETRLGIFFERDY
ncbi:MAG: translocation/assembly module TamB domain-containing protein, partial [Pseudomonadota bacterium]